MWQAVRAPPGGLAGTIQDLPPTPLAPWFFSDLQKPSLVVLSYPPAFCIWGIVYFQKDLTVHLMNVHFI